ncbi:P-loop containing nucleoside triphosphate hydrolase protein [Aspergillus pseudonomiae]|uniref:P-loop containing nucleoside triphosphate hydrolase protein n=1 Tax=Aspergillus pseudonomiae TaxID=1506151 RepID=A0A5N7D2Z4_9EURO|nr:P-loop containing nucleoside triphosphate hydrolase protein [Aspergillus pseudonomiae]KAE8400497.1 P-loop containing nucleoside triphosphate hydrolase protein [Aspergillus pseudonomiae]
MTPELENENPPIPTEEFSSSDTYGSVENRNGYIPVGILKKYIAQDTDALSTQCDDFPQSEVSNLEKHHWIWTHTYQKDHRWSYIRVYVLPDDVGRKIIPRSSTPLRRALKIIMAKIDRSPAAWSGCSSLDNMTSSSSHNSNDDESLWYIFNTLENPVPNPNSMRDQYTKKAMQQLLSVTLTRGEDGLDDSDNGADLPRQYSRVPSLRTALYPYQRRSAAAMIQREAQPAPMLDPRLKPYVTPTGQEYYYDKEEGNIIQEKRMYSEPRGGILAETMGCGKTLICIAVILATQGHFPQVPLEYQDVELPVRPQTGSLLNMAAATAGRLSLPWKSHFDLLRRAGAFFGRCIEVCKEHRGAYTIPPPPARYGSRTGVAYPRPPPQQILLCSATLVVVPPNLVNHWKDEIAKHAEGVNVLVIQNSADPVPPPDQLLEFDIVLFSKVRFEKEAGAAINNRRSSATPDSSPLTKLHWLRIIVDEGHNVAGHGHRTNMVHILDQLHVERRWIVSGTPSSGLYGVEVSLASHEANVASDSDLTEATAAVLHGKEKTTVIDSELKDLDEIRRIVVGFLDLKPWSNSQANDPANWTKYMKPVGEDGKRRKAQSLRATLQSLVVRHRMEVIYSEVPLPRLYNRVVRLEPTFYDKLNLNLFIFILAVNAITSERKDQDYMFHPRNRKHLSLVINNLRQAGFWWAGSDGNIQGTIDVALNYMEANRERMARNDVDMLTEGIQIAQRAIACQSWNAFKQFHELGVFIQDFPSHARGMWALSPSRSDVEPLLLGISQAHKAQNFVTARLNEIYPEEGLSGAGIKARLALSSRQGHPDSVKTKKTTPDKLSSCTVKTLPPSSPLAQTKLVATTSAKLTYLLDRVLELHTEEKIIIFYDNNNSAFWIAEGLELLGVDFRIYASTLKPKVRAAYLELFREQDDVRVLLMDLHQASHGLHIANASRVFIINPIWQPNVESQAIKRAHRIGQTRPVFVETLVLKDTLEDKMLERRKTMSEKEMQQAERDLLDDSTMSSIIQNEHFLRMGDDEDLTGPAYLKQPPGFFDRHGLPIPEANESPSSAKKAPRSRKRGSGPIDMNMDTTRDSDVGVLKRRRSDGTGLHSGGTSETFPSLMNSSDGTDESTNNHVSIFN